MFEKEIYIERRKALRELMKSGLLIFVGNTELPMNYPQNIYHFRQDSSFLYFFGIDEPGLAAVMDLDNGKEIVFGNDVEIEDVIWTGPLPLLSDKAKQFGITQTEGFAKFETYVQEAMKQNRTVHFLPPYNPNSKIFLSELLGISVAKLKENQSEVMKG